jgi:amino acid adenylation domain-containing protein
VKSKASNSLLGRLSAEKRSLLALHALKNREAAVKTRQGTIHRLPRVEWPSVFSLSFAQERLWFLDQLGPGGVAYNIAGVLRIKGALEAEVLERVVLEIVRRHEVLRTRFEQRTGVPVQVIEAAGALRLETVNLEGMMEVDQKRQIEELAKEEGGQPFDLARGPLLRMKLARLAKEEHVLFFTMHHIVSDGWSMGVLVKEFVKLYQAFSQGQPSPLAPLPIQYVDYAMWQRGWLQGEVLEKQLGYWKERLAGAPVLDLPTDRPRPAVQNYDGASERAFINRELLVELNKLSRREGVTLFMTLLAAFKVLLHRYSGQTDIVVGTPIANRNREETEGLVGFFVNTLALRTDLSGNPSFKELLRREREVAMGAYSHQDVPFERLVAELQVERNLNRSPLFQVMLNMLNLGDQTASWPGLVVEEMAAGPIQSKFDLTLYAREQANGLKLELVYNHHLFEQRRVEEMLVQLESVLVQAVSLPETSLDNFRLAAKWTKELILPQLEMKLEPRWELAVHQLFEVQARACPKGVAIDEESSCWTYEELNKRSNRLANNLRAQGIGAGERVAIYGNRSANLVLGMLGILKAGGSFMILDPSYPESRLKDQVRLAKPRGWLHLEGARAISSELTKCLAGVPQCFRVELPREWIGPQAPFEACSSESPGLEIRADQEAYVAFTSGTAGKPKGIIGTHLSLAHFVQWQGQEFGLGPEDRFSLLSGLSHDPLLRDIFTPLSLGARLCIPREPYQQSLNLAAWVKDQRISVMHLTPALGRLLCLSAGQSRQLPEWPALRYAFFGGDVLAEDVVKDLSALAPQVQCVNFYGTTETPQAMGSYRVGNYGQWQNHRLRRIPIGRGIEGVTLVIINQSRQPAGLGELGEIWVRSPYLAAGYLENVALNRERFQSNWFNANPADRMYRTGDLGRYLPDGNIEFWGRKDHQVKIRGFRVELGEIETALQKHGSVQQSVVVMRVDEPGEERLVAYVALKGGSQAGADELKGHLKGWLPEYMVPAFVVVLEKLPLTANGKVDRTALPAPEGRPTAMKYEAPRSQLELVIVGVWREILKTEKIGIHDNFFELGGHSLLATRLISQMRETFAVELPLRSIFETPTIAGLAEQIKAILWAASGSPAESNPDRQEGSV